MKRAGYAIHASVLLCGAAASLSAHHSFAAAYDTTNTVTVQGSIVQVRLTNPHSWFFLDVKEPDGKIARWAFGARAPSGLIRNGYKARELPRGTIVTSSGARARDLTQHRGTRQ